MQDVFISPLNTGLISWTEAFPNAKITAVVEPAKLQKDATVLFWLHMNEDRQQWLTNTITLIRKDFINAKIIVLANAPIQAEALHALSLGAVGYCHAYSAPAVLKEIKTVIIHGGLWLGNELLQRLIEISAKLAGNQPEQVQILLSQLTKRQKEVAIEAAKGLSNKEIARILDISERTVKAHLAATFECLKAKDRLQLALMLNSNYRH
ncbi:MAG: helix-turn-helix transcriptional regulator [Betaproteobacteria bacterium HGW-Betaproteobacteria-20]|jgi:DNA-binding NarL/FixJ family response regulator|nr:MAG: helix-turn-helix transcriptional regulator [Betaproteobacteria bacterium HGW-Betaproteobacteria-20]